MKNLDEKMSELESFIVNNVEDGEKRLMCMLHKLNKDNSQDSSRLSENSNKYSISLTNMFEKSASGRFKARSDLNFNPLAQY